LYIKYIIIKKIKSNILKIICNPFPSRRPVAVFADFMIDVLRDFENKQADKKCLI